MCRRICQPNEPEYQRVHVGQIHQRRERNVRLVRDVLAHLLATIEQLPA